jgi:hypothetical protein
MRKLFPANVNPIERAIRVVAGLALSSSIFIGPHTAWGFVGIVPLLTGIAGDCPLYTVFGFSTCSRSGAPAKR